MTRASIQLIQVARKQIGLHDDEEWRDFVERETGARSLRALPQTKRDALYCALVKQGFKPVSKPSNKRLKDGKYTKKLQALWIAAYNLGLIKDRSDKAMLSFVKRQTGIDHTRFLHYDDDAKKVIEALKAWIERDGDVNWSIDKNMPDFYNLEGFKIAAAQAKILNPVDSKTVLLKELRTHGFYNLFCLKSNDWIAIMNSLGEKIRSMK